MLDTVSTSSPIRWDCLDKMIGNTPLIRLDGVCYERDITIYAKAEMYNLSGSVKDRMALMIIRSAIESGALQIGQRIVEATSGSSGIALAAIGRMIGCPVTIFMPDWMSSERKALLKSYGAELRLVSRKDGGILGAMAMAHEFAAKEGAFVSEQFSNEDNALAHYQGTGRELAHQARQDNGSIGAFVAGVGTGGTVMGIGKYLKEIAPNTAIHPLEPASSPVLTMGRKVGSHRIQGVVDEFVPELVKLDKLDGIIPVDDGDAILMAQKICMNFGLGVGISSGANIVGAIKAALAREDGQPVATVLCDSNVRYLSTDLTGKEQVRDDYVTPQMSLTGMKVIAPANLT